MIDGKILNCICKWPHKEKKNWMNNVDKLFSVQLSISPTCHRPPVTIPFVYFFFGFIAVFLSLAVLHIKSIQKQNKKLLFSTKSKSSIDQ